MNTPSNVNQLSYFSPSVFARLVTLAGLAGLALAVVVGVIYFQDRHHETLMLSQQGLQRVDDEEEFLSGEIDAVRADVLFLAGQPLLHRFLEDPTRHRDELQQEYVRFAKQHKIYDQIRFLDLSGKEVVRINYRDSEATIVGVEALQEKTDRYYFREALKLQPGEVFISDFDLNVEHGQIEKPIEPVLRFLTPVVDTSGVHRGLLTLNYSGDHLLRRLNELSVPGAALLVKTDGHYIQGPTADDAWGWLLGHSRTFPLQFPLAWKLIAEHFRGLAVTSEGIFAYRRVSFGEATPEGQEVPALLLISYVPATRQRDDSRKLLQQLLWMYFGAMSLLVGFGWVWARSTAIRKQQANSIQASEARLRALSNQLLSAQEEERRSISRELHDQLGQQVTAISLDVQSAAKLTDPAKSHARLARAIEQIDQLLQSIHQFASRVRPSVLDDLGLLDALRSLVSEVHERTGTSIHASLEFEPQQISPKVAENVYRIVQEALANMAKHAHANQAAIAIRHGENQLQVHVEDKGRGFDPAQRDHSRLGLLGMQERVELLGGEFALQSAPGEGTSIHITIPLDRVSWNQRTQNGDGVGLEPND